MKKTNEEFIKDLEDKLKKLLDEKKEKPIEIKNPF